MRKRHHLVVSRYLNIVVSQVEQDSILPVPCFPSPTLRTMRASMIENRDPFKFVVEHEAATATMLLENNNPHLHSYTFATAK